jgi:hypothetical protein
MKRSQIDIGYIDIPKEYLTLDSESKKVICDRFIDIMLLQLDRNLSPEINRIDFLDEVLESSLITNEEQENFEVCQVISDCRKRLHDA